MNVKQKLTSVKENVEANKTKILAGALVVTTTFAVIQHRALKDKDIFLKENGLYDKYYDSPEI